MKAPDYKPIVNLTGIDANAFSILGAVQRALRQANADKEYIQRYKDEAMSGSYDHLLAITMEYVDVT